MARRGRKRKLKLDISPETLRSVFSVVLILLGGLTLISFFAPNYSINSRIHSIAVSGFGFPSILLPWVLMLGGLVFAQVVKWKFVELRVFLALSALLLILSSFFAVVGGDGGFVGDKIGGFMEGAISVYGAVIALLVGIVIVGLVLVNRPLSEISEAVSTKFEGIKAGKLFNRGGGEPSDELEISEGAQLELEDDDIEEEEQMELPAPAFEVIPSMSEPKPDEVVSTISAVGGKSVPGLPYSDKVWETPPLDLLSEPSGGPVDRGDVKGREKVIIETLKSFGIDAEIADVKYGPSVTQYAIAAGSGIRISRVTSLHHDLALALASPTGSVRIEAPIPGTTHIGIEVPNNTTTPVFFKEVLVSDAMKGLKSRRGIVLGKNVGGETCVYDIAKMPHLLVAGSTGSGKSVFLHSIIFSILYRCSPQECKFIFIDPKRVELVHYSGIPHLLTPVITDIDKAASVFRWAVDEMSRRYTLLEQAKVRNIDAYNEKSGFQAMPYIVIIVDELAEIMVADPALVEKSIIRLAQLARAVGIHLVLTVQRPSTNVITGLIKANIPCRVAFNVASQVDSRVIIDQPGAEKLLGKGDMLFVPPDASKPTRIQGAFVTDKEIADVVNYLKGTGIAPDYKEIVETKDKTLSVSAGGESKDDLFDEAVEIVVSSGKASASLLQRRLSIGYARAARILDELESQGIIGEAHGSKPRQILAKSTLENGDLADQPFDDESDGDEFEEVEEDEFVS